MISEKPPFDIASIRDAEARAPGLTGNEIGARVTRGMDKASLRAFAVEYIASWVDAMRRGRARAVERQSASDSSPELNSEVADFERVFADPPSYAALWNARKRERFRKWVGEDRWADWQARARVAVDEDNTDLFEEDWHPDGVRAARWERRRVLINQYVANAIEETARETRLEVTRELLASAFALGDGTQRTWGSATVADHRRRVDLLTGNAAGNVDSASLHVVAIRMIEAAGATCLNDLEPFG